MRPVTFQPIPESQNQAGISKGSGNLLGSCPPPPGDPDCPLSVDLGPILPSGVQLPSSARREAGGRVIVWNPRHHSERLETLRSMLR